MRNLLFSLLPFLCICCTKNIENKTDSNTTAPAISLVALQGKSPKNTSTWTTYTIQEGAHYCDQSTTRAVSGSAMNFKVRFDNSAIYPAVITDYNHAYDVNKLYGFSEGFSNQYNSARIGWRWLNNELQLLAYVYVNGSLLRDAQLECPFIKTVSIGQDITCSIAVSGNTYIFNVDGVVVTTPRGPRTNTYSGYQQFPYFGGTLTAPHLMYFYIQKL
ncbi:MAG: hypothetical protein ACM3VS_13745 [Candidatus Dadabacteria bacterium]